MFMFISLTELAIEQGRNMSVFMFEISFEFPATGARDFVYKFKRKCRR